MRVDWPTLLHQPESRLTEPLVLESYSLAIFLPILLHLPGQLGTTDLSLTSSLLVCPVYLDM